MLWNAAAQRSMVVWPQLRIEFYLVLGDEIGRPLLCRSHRSRSSLNRRSSSFLGRLRLRKKILSSREGLPLMLWPRSGCGASNQVEAAGQTRTTTTSW